MRRPPYLPFMQGPLSLAPGLRPINPRKWLYPDTEASSWLGEKRRLMQSRRDEVFASCAGEPLLEEAGRHVRGAGLAAAGWPTPLEAAASDVSDDLCILDRDDAGQWRLVAASLVAPTFWRLGEKLGEPLAGLHGPVPGACPVMVSRIHRILDGLRPGLVLERFNWTVQPGPERFTPSQADFLARAAQLPEEGALDALWLRVERQTVSRLPHTGAILFTIRVAIDPLRAVLAGSGAVDAFSTAWTKIDPVLAAYKGWPSYERLVSAAVEQARLAGRAGGSAGLRDSLAVSGQMESPDDAA